MEAKPSWWKRNWKWAVPLFVFLGLGSCGGCIALLVSGITGAIKSTDVYADAVRLAKRDARVIAALGEPIETGFLPSGSVEVSGPSGSADLAVTLKGSRGEGTLFIKAQKSVGRWQYEVLEVQAAGAAERIQLLGKPQNE
ncbi:MAG: hypothetical protein HYZ27_08480 [Deltaproteobacteria bacterium]|nr:hypothetical protein [Deltaproteobacteria bacterium]